MPPGMRRGNESFQVKKRGKSVDSSMQAKTPTSTVTPSTATTLAPASATASPATSRTCFGPAATASLISSTVILTNKIPDKQGVGITEGTTLVSGASEHKTECSRVAELETSDKNFSKNINKTTSQISASTDLRKTLQNTPPAIGTTRTTLPKATSFQIPRNVLSPKLRSSPTPAIAVDQAETLCKGRSKEMVKSGDNGACVVEDSHEVHSMQPLGTKQGKAEMLQRNKDKEKDSDSDRKEGEDILNDIRVGCALKGRAITLQLVPERLLFPLDRSQFSPGATTTSISADGTDENATAQGRECEREKRREWKEGREALEKTEETTEKERKGQDKNFDTKEEDMEKRENKSNQIFKKAVVVTEESPVPVQTLDAALQTELLYKDAEIQAVVKVSNKSTSMSPTMTFSWSHMDPTITLNNHEKVSETASVSLQNGQDVSLDSGLAGPVAKSLSPTHYASSMSKSTRQHVCQIQIELCSQSAMSDSMALPEEKDPEASLTRSELEMEPKQVNRKRDQAQTSPLPEVAWDEQGMTWEVYGAAVDMESLGFAIQNHLQCKIQEHEQRIRHLRKSISVSEHSNGDVKGAKKKRKNKKKRNVLRSLFQRPTSCFKTASEA